MPALKAKVGPMRAEDELEIYQTLGPYDGRLAILEKRSKKGWENTV